MERIVIQLSTLSKDNWATIYQFIRSIVNGESSKSKGDAFFKLKKLLERDADASLSYASSSGPETFDIDVSEPYSNKLDEIGAGKLETDTVFSILYKKRNGGEDFTELVPFVLLQQEFGNIVSLGIDVSDLENAGGYIFKCGVFFILYDDVKPKYGERSLYLTNSVDPKTRKSIPVSSLPGKGKSVKKQKGNSSRRFLPLLQITESNYKSIFRTAKEELVKTEDKTPNIYEKEKTKLIKTIEDSIKKLKVELEKYGSKFRAIFEQSDSLFDKWLEGGYFYSYTDDEDEGKQELEKLSEDEIKKIRNTLQIYKNSIYELIQNIIFHGGKNGLIYCVFDKKNNISKAYKERIPKFDKYDANTRFLRIGVYDYSPEGIVDTFKGDDSEGITLNDFFNTNSIVTTGLSRLEMRYAARLGIKTFVKTLVKHRGYLRVESNEKRSEKKKNYIETTYDDKNEEIKFSDVKGIDFVNGTHYEIILPVVPSENSVVKATPVQRRSVISKWREFLSPDSTNRKIKVVDLPIKGIERIEKSTDKDEQIRNIEEVGDNILMVYEPPGKSWQFTDGEIALNLNHLDFDDNINAVFKVIAYLQLTKKTDLFTRIVLFNASKGFVDKFCSNIKSLLVDNSDADIPIWSKESAIVLISEEMHVQMIWGGTKDELVYINRELQKYYLDNIFVTEHFLSDNTPLSGEAIDKAEAFILPYDLLIDTEEKYPIFESLLSRLLRKKMVSKERGLGFSVNHDYTYIGSKVIVRNYYEADLMFQNSFFTERFAYLIAHNIKKVWVNKEKELVLIGYKHYSEFLLKAIKQWLDVLGVEKVHVAIANDENIAIDENNSRNSFNVDKLLGFDIDGKGADKIEERILKDPDSYRFATIVPIGSTLSTNDKIIAFFKLWCRQKENDKAKEIKNDAFIYNHCVILVRDKIQDNPTDLEKEQKWDKIDVPNHTITTSYQNAKTIHYTVQVAGDTDNNWIRRLNDYPSFPSNWEEEQYVNSTENSSINSQNLMGFPKVNTNVQHEIELTRLFGFEEDIYKGHIEVFNSHHKYYVDTETFIRRNLSSSIFVNWLKCLKGKLGQDKLNVLVTPNAESESDFIYAVNNHIYDQSALIIHLDVKKRRNNIEHKLSFLKDIEQNDVNYHYVDQALLTGETFRRTQSLLWSILREDKEGDKEEDSRKEVKFSSVITVVNRLSYARTQEIEESVGKGNLFAYVNLHYPASAYGESECELCRLQTHYRELKKKSVLETCRQVIDDNLEKIKKTSKEEKKKDKDDLKRQHFLRLLLTHELYYRISKLFSEASNFEDACERVENELDSFYEQLGSDIQQQKEPQVQPKQQEPIQQELFGRSENQTLFDYLGRQSKIDGKISFLKAISSPPLAQYIAIRAYAHKKLLNELKAIIDNNNSSYGYDDLKLMKSILKSLSFLKSNALVRKAVILGAWKVLLNAAGSDERTIKKFSKDMLFFIKNAIDDDDAKATFLGELLRTGNEINFEKGISVSKTILSLKNGNDGTAKNDLFDQFSDAGDLFKKEYTNFLVWLFYDNTTILRKTLDSFSKELKKDARCKNYFYTANGALKKMEDVREYAAVIIAYFKEKVETEYYYSSFKPYLNNGDGIDFVRKLVYVLYAKLKLKDLLENKNKADIETDTRDLMEIFSAIMGADGALWTMKKRNPNNPDSPNDYYHLYPISQYGVDCWNYQQWDTEDFYTSNVYNDHEEIKSPIIPIFRAWRREGEKKYLQMSGLSIYVMQCFDNSARMAPLGFDAKKKKNTVASVTFLYEEKNEWMIDELSFRIGLQEFGRLMLLLKDDIDDYLANYLIGERVFDIWIKKHESDQKFKKIYYESSHVFRQVYQEMDEFDDLENDIVEKMAKTWFFLSNATISFLYSNIEKHIENGKHLLIVGNEIVIDENNTWGKSFDKSFFSILSALFVKRDWNYGGNEIYVNGTILSESELDNTLSATTIPIHKNLLRTFVVQCLDNALKKHKGVSNVKRVDILIDKSSISIKDSYITKKTKDDTKKFKKRKKPLIDKLECEKYSSTTLTSLRGVINFLKKEKKSCECEYDFDNEDNFYVTIKFE